MEPLERCCPEFASPEVSQCIPVSFESDIFSLGTLFYSCLTGLSPFLAMNDKVQYTLGTLFSSIVYLRKHWLK